MNWQLIFILTAIAVALYAGLSIAEKLLIKRRAKQVMKNDNGTGTNADRVDDNE